MKHTGHIAIRARTALALTLILILAMIPGIGRPALSQTTTPPATGAASLPEQRGAVTLNLPASEVAWRVGTLQTGTETDPAIGFEPGFVYALDDPLLLLFDNGTPLQRIPSDAAYPVDAPVQGHPVPMMAEAPVPFATIGIGAPDPAADPGSPPFPIEGGEYELSLWLVDTAAQVSTEVGTRLASQEHPILVFIRSGEIDAPPTPPETTPRRLVAGDWAVIDPTDRLQAVDGSEPPVVLFGTLDQPNLQPEPPTGQTGAPPPPQPGGAPPMIATGAPTETTTSTATTTHTATATATAAETATATATETATSPSEPGTGGDTDLVTLPPDDLPIFATEAPSSSFELPPSIDPTIFVEPPDGESGQGGAGGPPAPSSSDTGFESMPAADLPIFRSAPPDSVVSGSQESAADGAAVEQFELSCHAIADDSDGDRLSDECEKEYGSDPNKPDSDGDGLTDGAEVFDHKSDPTSFDTDGDGLTDGDEVSKHKSSPILTDSDGDDLQDSNEVNEYNTDPANPDSDGDGLDDGFDLGSGTDPLNADFDGDGLYDGDEVYIYGTYPKVYDSDEDGLGDGDEVNVHKTNPLDMYTDEDCLNDGEEIAIGTSPFVFDTDGDGYDDKLEGLRSTNPLDSNDTPGEVSGVKIVDHC